MTWTQIAILIWMCSSWGAGLIRVLNYSKQARWSSIATACTIVFDTFITVFAALVLHQGGFW